MLKNKQTNDGIEIPNKNICICARNVEARCIYKQTLCTITFLMPLACTIFN